MMEKKTVTAEEIDAFYREFMKIQDILYPDHWHMGGEEAIDTLTQKAGLAKGMKVLDAGCGIGGPARYLVQKCDCHVTGLNISAYQVNHAREKTKAAGLDHKVAFKVGSFMEMPFNDGSFDLVWSQDAFAHGPDKKKIIEESYRILKSGGKLAFQDHLQVGPMTKNLEEYCLFAACPGLETLEGYEKLLQGAGFTVLGKEDLTDYYRADYLDRMKIAEEKKEELMKVCDQAAIDMLMQFMKVSIATFGEERSAGGGRFIAKKP
jgi:ubiquinone/menaquinone biosynthesis C-methylase UbiE